MSKNDNAYSRFNSNPDNWKSEKKPPEPRKPLSPSAKKAIYILLVLVAAVAICFATVKTWEKATTPDYSNVTNPQVTIEMESGDIIRLELYPQIAPITVANFVDLAQSGYYDGLIFHRVIANFMVQGGDPEGTGMGGPGFTIKGEFAANGVKNDLSHTRGVLSMARKGTGNDTAGSQFFIMHADTPSLDGQYAAFGKVMDDESLATIDKIASTKTDSNDKPLSEWKIKTVTVDTFGYEYKPVRIGG